MAGSALIVVDMLNTYDFEDADTLASDVEGRLDAMRGRIGAAREAELPVIYVNDNLGEWRSDREQVIEDALAGRRPDLVEPLLPAGDDMLVVKARHTIFFQTPLEYLLRQREIDDLTLVGQVTEQCILYSALDAYVRHLKIRVPRDAVAHIHEDLAEAALRMMEVNMDAELVQRGVRLP